MELQERKGQTHENPGGNLGNQTTRTNVVKSWQWEGSGRDSQYMSGKRGGAGQPPTGEPEEVSSALIGLYESLKPLFSEGEKGNSGYAGKDVGMEIPVPVKLLF